MKILEIKNVSKSFKRTKVLNNFSLNINEGEVVGITGPSGVGKSTLLRIINGLEGIENGNISINGQSLIREYRRNKAIYSNKKILKEMNLNTGMVFQDFNLFPHLSVIQNIMLPLKRVLKMNKEVAKEKAMKLLEKMNLEEKAYNYPYELSGGQKQRVAIARTLSLNPKILCFDEPTSSLDEELTYEIVKIIKKLREENITIIVVSHEMEFTKAVSDRIIKIEKV